MSERITKNYKRIFEIWILHHYWLDDGDKNFDELDSAKKDKHLLAYDVRQFLSIMPTPKTEKALKGLCCIFKSTSLGCYVGIQDQVTIPSDTVLEFAVTIRDTSFHNYTALTLQSRTMYELYHQPEGRICRYKENISTFSNSSGASRNIGGMKRLFLSKEIFPFTSGDKVESLYKSGNALMQLTRDDDVTNAQTINAHMNNLPVFANQRDVEKIVPPAGLVGVPERGIELSEGTPSDIFALIRLQSTGATDSDFDFIDGNGLPKEPHPVFQIRFKNRSTYWTYLNKATGSEDSFEANPFPLTYFGNARPSSPIADKKPKASSGPVKASKSGSQIIKLVSEIFI